MIFCTVYGEVSAQFIYQGEQMVDAGTFNSSTLSGVADPVFTFCCLALVQYVISPTLARCGFQLTPLRKFIFGLGCAFCAMCIAAGVEIARKNSPVAYVNERGVPVNDISLFVQLPQYFCVSLGEAFSFVAGIEFYYREMPDPLKSLGQAVNQWANAFASIFEIILLQAIAQPLGWIQDNLNEGQLDYYFFLLAGLCFAGVAWGIFCDHLYARGGGSYEDMQLARLAALRSKNLAAGKDKKLSSRRERRKSHGSDEDGGEYTGAGTGAIPVGGEVEMQGR